MRFLQDGETLAVSLHGVGLEIRDIMWPSVDS